MPPDFAGAADALGSAPRRQSEEPNQFSPIFTPPPDPAIARILTSLVHRRETESDFSRRQWVMRFRQAEEFWRGNQNLVWSNTQGNWLTPDMQAAVGGVIDRPKYDYVTDVWSGFGMSIIAALSQRLPEIEFLPVSALSEQDIATSKAANRALKLVYRNNSIDVLRIYQSYLLYTQGSVATYVRYLVDPGRFGTHQEVVFQPREQELLPDRLDCPNCTAFLPASQVNPAGSQCPQCGEPLGLQNFQPRETAMMPVPVGQMDVPNGAELLTSYGPLNYKVPPHARDIHGCGYLGLVEEVDVGALRAAYPNMADRIKAGVGSGEVGQMDALARMSISGAPQGQMSFEQYAGVVTYRRFWLRPTEFWAIDDKDQRNLLLQQFPEGCLVAMAQNECLAVHAEKMDDHWSICHALPGQGQYRPGLGASGIPIQQQINDAGNMLAEQRDFAGAPPVFYDQRFIGDTAFGRRCEPGEWVAVAIESGTQTQLDQLVFQPQFRLDPAVYGVQAELINLGQQVVGATPTILGTGQSHLDTAEAYNIARETALGRLRITYTFLKQHDAEVALLAVRCMQKNRTQDMETVITGKSRQFQSEFVRLAELQGNILAYPKGDQDFPQTYAEIRQNILQILNAQDPKLAGVLTAPINLPVLNRFIGIEGLIFPDEENRSKQFREIDLLLQGQPFPDPNTGALMPSVPTDKYVDDADVHIATIQEWAESDDGMDAKEKNPAGYANVICHLLLHQSDKAQLQQVDQVAFNGAPPGGAPGAPAPSGAQQ